MIREITDLDPSPNLDLEVIMKLLAYFILLTTCAVLGSLSLPVGKPRTPRSKDFNTNECPTTAGEYADIYSLLLSSPWEFSEKDVAFVHFCAEIYKKEILTATTRSPLKLWKKDARDAKAKDTFTTG